MELTNFQEDVLNREIPVLVDFFATWCGPCKMLSPVLEELDAEYGGRVKIVKIDIDKHIELARQFRVATVPTMMIFENGEAKETVIGYHTKEELVDLLGL